MHELLILRHGQTCWNAKGRFQGHLDSPLTQLGIQQAHRLNALLKDCRIDGSWRGFVSPLGRAQATAQIALNGVFENWETDARLAEIDVGDYSGMTRDQVAAADPRFFDDKEPFGWQFRCLGGETYAGFQDRILDFLNGLGGPAVIVAHGVTSRVMRGLLLGLAPDQLDGLPGGQGNIHRVSEGVASVLA